MQKFSHLFLLFIWIIFFCCHRCSSSRFSLVHTDYRCICLHMMKNGKYDGVRWEIEDIKEESLLKCDPNSRFEFLHIFFSFSTFCEMFVVESLKFRFSFYPISLRPCPMNALPTWTHSSLSLSFFPSFDVQSTFYIALHSKQRQPHWNSTQYWKLRHKIDLILFIWTYVTEKRE